QGLTRVGRLRRYLLAVALRSLGRAGRHRSALRAVADARRLRTQIAPDARGLLAAAQAEGKPECERDRGDEPGEHDVDQRLHEAGDDAWHVGMDLRALERCGDARTLRRDVDACEP